MKKHHAHHSSPTTCSTDSPKAVDLPPFRLHNQAQLPTGTTINANTILVKIDKVAITDKSQAEVASGTMLPSSIGKVLNQDCLW